MRQDMHKLTRVRTIETVAPRKLILSRGQVPRDVEDLPYRQSMRAATPHYSGGGKVNNLAPALRWLRAQAGRPWSAVYAELRGRFDPRNTSQQRILELLLNRIDREVYFNDAGQPRVASAYGSYAVDGLYVHPSSGLLLNANLLAGAAVLRRQARAKQAADQAAVRIRVSATRQLHCLDGLWFWVELAPVTLPQYIVTPDYVLSDGTVLKGYSRLVPESVCQDVLTGREFFSLPVEPWQYRELLDSYGRKDHYAARKWQASRTEVARAKRAVLMQ